MIIEIEVPTDDEEMGEAADDGNKECMLDDFIDPKYE